MGARFGDERLPARFWAKVDDPADERDCWLWKAALDTSGYGKIGWQGTQLGAHRVAYLNLIGPIPAGLQLDHLCRVRNCVNPAHLEPVTARANVLRGETIPAREARQTHCVRGHELSGENLRASTDGYRRCRECKRINESQPSACERRRAYMRAYYLANRERWRSKSVLVGR